MIRRARPDNITTLIIPVLVLVILAAAMSQIPARAFVLPNVDRGGYEMRVWLDTTLSIMSSRVGDRFTATVGDPGPFNLARISGHVESIAPSELVKGVTEMYLSFDRIRLSDGQAYPINAEIIRLYDVPSGQQVGATDMIETRARSRPQTLKRTGIGALAGGIFGVTLRPGGGGAVTRPRLVSAGMIAASGRNELMLDRGVEILLRVYHN